MLRKVSRVSLLLVHALGLIAFPEMRARSALKHMEMAMQAGVKPAAEQLMKIHFALSQLYQAQAQQYRDLEVLPKGTQ